MIIPAILEENINKLKTKLDVIDTMPGVKKIHIDFCNLAATNTETFTLKDYYEFIKLQDINQYEVEAHLMLDYIDPVLIAKCNFHKVYIQAKYFSPTELLDLIEDCDRLNINFNIALTVNEDFSEYINKSYFKGVLLVSVEPGKQGQVFNKNTPNYIEAIKRADTNVTINIDGGINAEIIKSLSQYNIKDFVVGSALLHAENPSKAYLNFINLQ